MEETTKQTKFLLKGSDNFVPWLTKLNNYCFLEDLMNGQFWPDEIVTPEPTPTIPQPTSVQPTTAKLKNAKTIKKWINENIDHSLISFDATEPLKLIMESFHNSYGTLHLDPEAFKDYLKNTIYFDPALNPQATLNWLDDQLKLLTGRDAKITQEEYKRILLHGIGPRDLSKPHEHFWFHLYGKMKCLPADRSKLRSAIWEYWSNYQSDIIKTAQSQATSARKPILPGVKPTSSHVEGKLCTHCKINGREKVMKSHTFENCFFKEFKDSGFPRKETKKSTKSNANSVELNELVALLTEAIKNKATEQYFHDTGCTPTSFTSNKPINFFTKPGSVGTAGGTIFRTLGEGTIKFGDLKMTATYCPDFTRNLVSGIQINNSGLFQTIANDHLVVHKDPLTLSTIPVATGKLNTNVGLIQMDQNINNEAVSKILKGHIVDPNCLNTWKEIHEKLGHVSDETMRKTISKVPAKPKELCEPCALGKARRPNVPKETRTDIKILEKVSLDIQGPFRIPSYDGYRYNLKLVENSSGYIKMEWLKNKGATNVAEAFIRYQRRMERRTGKKIKSIQVDGGDEFNGALADHLEKEGIIKEKGDAYEHHFPGHAENAHRLILNRGRANHLASNLPAIYYSDALNYTVYTHNKTSHSGKIPFESIYKRKVDLSLLYPFGCVGYMFVPKEKRDGKEKLGKLEPSGKRVRLLGFGDDDDSEEILGWKVLLEDDLSIHYTKTVRWDINAERTPLQNQQTVMNHGEELYDLDDPMDDDFEIDDEPPTPDLLSTSSDDGNSIAAYVTTFGMIPLSYSKIIQGNYSRKMASLAEYAKHCPPTLPLSPEEAMYCHMALLDGVPINYQQAMQSNEKELWQTAMNTEISKMNKEQVYSLEHLPQDNLKRNVVKNRWVFKKKLNSKGEVIEYKARLVAKGYSQRYGLDFMETFAPVAKLKSIRAITALATLMDLDMYQDDVPSAFLKAEFTSGISGMEGEGWMEQPEGHDDGSGRKCRLLKCIYGLKQSPREFHSLVNNFLVGEGFQPNEADPCAYQKLVNGHFIIVAVYVDDIITAGKRDAVSDFRLKLHSHFNMDGGGDLNWYLGIHFSKKNGNRTLDQTQYVNQKLKSFKSFIGSPGLKQSSPLPTNVQELLEKAYVSTDYEPNFPYRQMVGGLMYAMVGTRFDLCYAVSIVSQFLHEPKKIHCDMVRHIYQYLRSYPDLKLTYLHDAELKLEGFVDAGYSNNFNYRSTSGYVMTLGGSAISWYSKRQATTALSAAESEYIAAVPAGKECLWWKLFLKPFGLAQSTITLHEDNQAAIALTKNPQFHDRTKHIQTQYHWIREQVANDLFKLSYINTKSQLADIFTKSLKGFALRPVCRLLGLFHSMSLGDN